MTLNHIRKIKEISKMNNLSIPKGKKDVKPKASTTKETKLEEIVMQLKIKISEEIIENKAVPLKEGNKSENALARLKKQTKIYKLPLLEMKEYHNY